MRQHFAAFGYTSDMVRDATKDVRGQLTLSDCNALPFADKCAGARMTKRVMHADTVWFTDSRAYVARKIDGEPVIERYTRNDRMPAAFDRGEYAALVGMTITLKAPSPRVRLGVCHRQDANKRGKGPKLPKRYVGCFGERRRTTTRAAFA